jgi:hypothetical protein
MSAICGHSGGTPDARPALARLAYVSWALGPQPCGNRRGNDLPRLGDRCLLRTAPPIFPTSGRRQYHCAIFRPPSDIQADRNATFSAFGTVYVE